MILSEVELIYLFLSEMYSSPLKKLILHRIHECALDFFEHDDAEEKQHGSNSSGNSEALPWDCAAEEDRAEALDDGSHWVEIHEESVFFRNHAGWVDDGRGRGLNPYSFMKSAICLSSGSSPKSGSW